MGRRNKDLPVIHQLEVTDIGAGGKAIARYENQVILISHAIPGDVVDVQIRKKRKNYLEGEPVHFSVHSPLRTDPFCDHFNICGGCTWQDLAYPEQLSFKQKQVEDQLARISGLGSIVKEKISPILSSPETTGYRNKLEFTFSSKRWLTREEISSSEKIIEPALGFHAPGRFDKVIDIQYCYLQPEPSNAIRNFIREYALKHNIPFFDIRAQKGLLRNLIIRTTTTGELMVILSFFYRDEEIINALLSTLQQTFPQITSLQYAINPKGNDTLEGIDVQTFSGKSYISEKIGKLQCKIGPKSFFQTNTRQAENLYRVAADFASPDGQQCVYDLYSGTGTIALYLAGKAKHVIGIESIPEAVTDANENAGINNILNVTFITGDVKDQFTDTLFDQYGQPDTVVLDPPRAGLHQDIIDMLVKKAPGRIVYVSCNPATQARDLIPLLSTYRVEKIQPVDMFPHTSHVENIILLILNNPKRKS